MSLWNKILGLKNEEIRKAINSNNIFQRYDANKYTIIDTEVSIKDKKIHDIGAIRYDGSIFHKASKQELSDFIKDCSYICGHNIIHHDAKYLFNGNVGNKQLVDTLYISPLLFPEKPYHKLVKDDKLVIDQLNNPVNDCKKAKDLLYDEISQWAFLPEEKRLIYTTLLKNIPEFKGFLSMVNAEYLKSGLSELISKQFYGKICEHANIEELIERYPCECAYALALIDTTEHSSITPGWVLRNYPNTEYVIKRLRQTRCSYGCQYCNTKLNVNISLKKFFGYDKFRTYEGEPLQERAAQAAIDGKSLLAIFPTGGGKSLTFQLPALMEGMNIHGLTVVISPLQSLMKDQVDNLIERGITDAVTINGMLDPISRSLAIQRVQDGEASLLYISPEMLRSKTIERILLARNIVRFVIDEAHCFSSWGQDFRVDYLYIGKFISEYQNKKGNQTPVPVSCFTATAKPKVIQDICDYFKSTLDLKLELFASTATRTNLQYSVIHAETEEDKYSKLRNLIGEFHCPTIIYVSRTKRTIQIARKLTQDGYKALPFHGGMDSDYKIANQEAFMQGQANIIVATSAFGMGVDKKDVGLVVHYDISDSLENYVQEAGRAGRDPNLNANCYVLYSDNDLDKHFILLNQTKLSFSEIQQVWKAIKDLTKQRSRVCCSGLEIARQAGWDDSVNDIETRVRTALSSLEQSGYIERGNNVPHVYATGITVKNMEEARKRLNESALFTDEDIEKAARIIKSLISQKYISKAGNQEAESRIDHLADILAMTKREVITYVELMRQEGILADSKDMSAFLLETGSSEKKAMTLLNKFQNLERFIVNAIPDESIQISYKQLNEDAINEGISNSKEKDIKTIIYFLSIKGYTQKRVGTEKDIKISRVANRESTIKRIEKRWEISKIIIEWLYKLVSSGERVSKENNAIQFSVVELLNYIKSTTISLFINNEEINIEDIEEALLYLSKIGALKLEGGFLVIYNAMDIKRTKDSKVRYKKEDYRLLNEFYKQKIQQVHIVGEYANLMVKDYDAALKYVKDYFQMDYKLFISKYFKGERLADIDRNITPNKYNQLFGQLSERQLEIISNKESRCIVVAAGPGSGKTRVLVHKLASLLLMEDVKHEQLLMLTFSRAAATEFKQRLMELIGNAAHFVEIKTFHSYCFDLLGRIGNLDGAKNVVLDAANMIGQGEVEPNKIGKTVLVIDEAQDMGADEYSLLKALMNNNEDMRVIAVGDDDQNIYEFRGSNSNYMKQLLSIENSTFVEMTENYRSAKNVVNFANKFVNRIEGRMKSTCISSKRDTNGWVKVVHHKSKQAFIPLVEEIKNTKRNGTTCILTQTNFEAAIITALLRKNRIKSKLVQTMDEIRFYNMAEMKYLTNYITKNITTPLISEEIWENAKSATFNKYQNSKSISYVKKCVQLFEETNNAKYFSDFKEYVYESSLEDFCDISGENIVVSTIHKAKGKEFDNVYMLICNRQSYEPSQLRCLYVGMTRAKNYLAIHTNSNYFNNIKVDEMVIDTNEYPMPEEILLQLSHRDVNLGYFKNKKQDILKMRAGNNLNYSDFYLYNPLNELKVAKLSQKMQSEITDWMAKGYKVKSAEIRFIVAWKPKDAPKEETATAVILPDITLAKN